jgi:hypothetical protein
MSIITPVGIEDPARSLTRKTVIGAIVTVALASAGLILALILFAQYSSTILHVYFGAIGLAIGLSAINRFAGFLYATAEGRSRPARRQRKTAPNWPNDLFDLNDRVSLAKVSAFDHQSRLRPLLRELATQRLDARWHLELSKEPASALPHLKEALRVEVFDQPDPADLRELRDVPGPSLARLQQLVDELESI